MSKFILFTNGILAARYDVAIHGDNIPADAVPVTEELFFQTINETDGIWALVDGEIIKQPLPEPSQEEALAQAVESVRAALQSTIDEKAKSFGFSSGNALMLYAGFENPFKPLASTFAVWEATVWVEAEAYKAEVLAGTKPLLSAEEAVLLMPVYPS